VVAVDCALNRAFSPEVDLEENCLVDLRVAFRAFRHDASARGLIALAQGDAVRDGDRIKLELIPNRKSYLYIINVDTEDRLFVLFPHSQINISNPIESFRKVILPGKRLSFKVDSTKGAEFIYIFASLEPDEELESLIKEMRREGNPRTTQTFRGLMKHRGLGNIEADDSFTSKGDYWDILEKKVHESQAARKYVFPHL